MESVLIKGDLAKLTPDERNNYYSAVCRSLGLNPLTQPFSYIMLNGKLTLYAKRDAADQLRKINNISIEIVSQEQHDDLLTVHVRARDATGRTDEDLGVVAFPPTLKGEARANAILKCVTKAKRRVTLSISGLGFLDETEVEDIPASAKRPVAAPNVMTALPAEGPAPHDPKTGEILPSGDLSETEEYLRNEAWKGTAALQTAWRNLSPEDQRIFADLKDTTLKPIAIDADKIRAMET
jgi:hypothetical protein